MEKQKAKARIEKLRKLIERYRYSYHVLDKSLVSDSVNDSLKHELQEIENQFPEFITPDSPTQRVGGKPLDKFKKVTHSQPMLSLVDAFSFNEIKQWQERNARLFGTEDCKPIADSGFFCELKMDGLAVSLIYENGLFVRGATRGDGKIGEDVTRNLKTIESIPLKIPVNPFICSSIHLDFLRKIEIRGEVFMPIKTFEALNKKYKKEGRPLLKNPRNAAAGSIRQLNPKLSAERKLDFIAWDLLLHPRGVVKMVKNHGQSHRILQDLGFKTIKENQFCRTLDEVEKFKQKVEKQRDKLPFQIDGIVILINDNKLREKLGIVGKAPRGMIAYKFAPEETTTVVKDIRVQVGRTGTLTPVAILKPVLVAGSTVSRATLHNEDEIRKKDIKIGDTVIVRKAGDVIPEVFKVIKEMRSGKEKQFHFPRICPVCGGLVVREKGKAAYKCKNKKCFTIRLRVLQHFVSKAAFDMSGLGPKILNKFMDEGLIKDAADLFELKEGDIKPLERFAEKSASNIVQSVGDKKLIDLPRFIYALGIPNVGEETAYEVAEYLNQNDIEKIKNITLNDWQQIPDIGSVVAQSIYDYFQDKQNQDFIKRLFEAGVKIKAQRLAVSGQRLGGKTFVFTGTLEKLTRDEAKEKVRSLGADVSESVSKETSYVVTGTEPGSKYDKAKKLNIKILSEQEFLKLTKKAQK